jgi:hypothetical protein
VLSGDVRAPKQGDGEHESKQGGEARVFHSDLSMVSGCAGVFRSGKECQARSKFTKTSGIS